MASSNNVVTVQVVNGPSVEVLWTHGMNAQQALEDACNILNRIDQFTFALQYYGSTLGYLVEMINETYDTFMSKAEPFYYWEFFHNDQPSQTGIDHTILNSGDTISFSYELFQDQKHRNSLLRVKNEVQMKRIGR